MTALSLARVGLRVDVLTLRGTRRGVPALLEMLARHGVKATFFFSVGPDTLGRFFWRLLKPCQLRRAIRTKALRRFGWSFLLSGTAWPGAIIGEQAPGPIRLARDAGHEIGLYAWDHHAWLTMDLDNARRVREAATRAVDLVTEILGHPPATFAAPGCRLTAAAARILDTYPFDYRSDCRGFTPFVPRYAEGGDGVVAPAPQVPLTLPTYDEQIGYDGVTDANYNERQLGLLRAGAFQTMRVLAEFEGIGRAALFDDFLWRAAALGVRFTTLRELLPASVEHLPRGLIDLGPWPGCLAPVCRQVPPGLDGADALPPAGG